MSVDCPLVAVCGAGAWGTALAIQLARNGVSVNLWGHDLEHVQQLRSTRENSSLPGCILPEAINFFDNLQQATRSVDYLLIAIPSQAYREFLGGLKTFINADIPVFWASKGFEIETGKFLHQLVIEELDSKVYGVISGPTFAMEVSRNLPAAVTCASNDDKVNAEFSGLLHGGHFRCYTSQDIIGVEVGGALKNVLAIAVGVADGLGFGANTRAALITRGLTELMRFGEKLGAQRETMMGLSGLGDLILTCTDNQSRNRRFGLALGKGESVEQAIDSIGQTVEGYRAAKAVHIMAEKMQVSVPIMEQVFQLIYQGKPAREAVAELENRDRKPEVMH